MVLSKDEKKRRKEERRLKKWSESHEIIDDIDYKKCSLCDKLLQATQEFFYLNKTNNIDGLYPYCKDCTKNRTLQWQYDNYEYWKTIVAKRDATPKKVEQTRAHSKRQKEEGYYKEWLNNNKDKSRMYSENRAQHKTHEISEAEWKKCKKYFHNTCAYCGLHIDNHYRIYSGEPQKIDLHKEHADHNGSNKIDNCIPSCISCNSRKHDKDLLDWYRNENENYTKERLNLILKWLNGDWKEAAEKNGG